MSRRVGAATVSRNLRRNRRDAVPRGRRSSAKNSRARRHGRSDISLESPVVSKRLYGWNSQRASEPKFRAWRNALAHPISMTFDGINLARDNLRGDYRPDDRSERHIPGEIGFVSNYRATTLLSLKSNGFSTKQVFRRHQRDLTRFRNVPTLENAKESVASLQRCIWNLVN